MYKFDRRNSLVALLALSCLIFTGLGCNLADRLKASQNSDPGSETPATDRPTIATSNSGTPVYGNADALAALLAELKTTVGSDDPNVLKILVYESHASIQYRIRTNRKTLIVIRSGTVRSGRRRRSSCSAAVSWRIISFA